MLCEQSYLAHDWDQLLLMKPEALIEYKQNPMGAIFPDNSSRLITDHNYHTDWQASTKEWVDMSWHNIKTMILQAFVNQYSAEILDSVKQSTERKE